MSTVWYLENFLKRKVLFSSWFWQVGPRQAACFIFWSGSCLHSWVWGDDSYLKVLHSRRRTCRRCPWSCLGCGCDVQQNRDDLAQVNHPQRLWLAQVLGNIMSHLVHSDSSISSANSREALPGSYTDTLRCMQYFPNFSSAQSTCRMTAIPTHRLEFSIFWLLFSRLYYEKC